MSQGQSSLRVTDMIYMLSLNETIQPVWSLCHCYHCPLLYFSLIHNGPPPMSTLVPTWRQHRCSRVLGVWEGPALPVSTSNWHSVTQISSLELSPSCHHVTWLRRKAWCLDTRGFIPKKIKWHIHTGPWSLVNCMVWSAYETLYKGLMNINENGCWPWGWPQL